VLGVIFLKYISDSFWLQRHKLEAEYADPHSESYIPDEEGREFMLDNPDAYTGAGVFYVPPEARWEMLQENASQPNIKQVVDQAMEKIEKSNESQLKNVLPKNYTASAVEAYNVGQLINVFSRIDFNHDLDKEKDILGRVYEYFLGQFADAEGKRGGEFFTPRSIVELLVKVLEPSENARVFDPACGTGGMFVQSSRFLHNHDENPSKISFFGQESNPTTWRLCKMNLAIRGIGGDIEYGDTYYADQFPDLRADYVLTNPPFNAKWKPSRLADNDRRFSYGVPPQNNANFMWVQHFLSHLAPSGLAGFVMANGALTVGGEQGEIRKQMVDDDLVDVIISCPAKLFYTVQLPVSLWFMSKGKQATNRFRNREGETLFIDASELYEQISRRQVVFTEDHIQKIADTVRAWRGEDGAGEYHDELGFARAVSLEEIRKNGHVLTPGRYVGLPEEEEDDEPFAEKIERLTNELEASFEKSRQLEKDIRENLKEIRV
jgi:type I restriction enzyme M protein